MIGPNWKNLRSACQFIQQICTEDYEKEVRPVLPIWTEGQKKGRARAVW